VLDRVLMSHPLLRQLKDSKSLNSNLFAYYTFDAGFNGIIDLAKGYNEVLKNLSKRLKRYLRKSKEEISKRGELKLHRISGTSDVRSLFKTYRELSVRAFRTRNKLSAFEDKNRCRFYEELLILLDKKNRLDAHKLTVGTSTLGISFGYRLGKGFKWILTAYNPNFYQLRPGHLLIEALINEAINNGDPYFDMYYGGEAFYKQQWYPKLIPLKHIEICRNNFVNKSISLTRNTLRSNKIFMNSARKARRIVHKMLI
jgi:CelD/BcsL family acetyltransferase involved in cellulose biosynthesis